MTTPKALEHVSNIMPGMFSKLHRLQIYNNVSPRARRGKKQHDYWKIQTQRSLKARAQRLTPAKSCTGKVLRSLKMMLRVRRLKHTHYWGPSCEEKCKITRTGTLFTCGCKTRIDKNEHFPGVTQHRAQDLKKMKLIKLPQTITKVSIIKASPSCTIGIMCSTSVK